MENYKDIVNIWIGLAICAYAGKTNCNDCRKFYNFTTNKIKFLEKTNFYNLKRKII